MKPHASQCESAAFNYENSFEGLKLPLEWLTVRDGGDNTASDLTNVVQIEKQILTRSPSFLRMEFCSMSKWSVFVWYFWKRSPTAASCSSDLRSSNLRRDYSRARSWKSAKEAGGVRARTLSKTGSCCRLVKNSGCTVDMVQSGQLKHRLVSSLRGGQNPPPQVFFFPPLPVPYTSGRTGNIGNTGSHGQTGWIRKIKQMIL